ncbi:hypothetical protein [Psychrobacillus sp.]|uniref:hypothetical protein n=1 Tax=Psychrobacillus sp. TaxID=1871623 RepID=UPI0028BF4C53|nr:hypothetical protein [Psychrobacillus sp.]
MQKLFPLHVSISIENFSEIKLENDVTILRLRENSLLCTYDDFLLEIAAATLTIKSLTPELLCVHVDELHHFKLTKKENA